MCGANLTGGRRSEMEAMVKMFMRGVFIQTSTVALANVRVSSLLY
jgi:hypothetical protein